MVHNSMPFPHMYIFLLLLIGSWHSQLQQGGELNGLISNHTARFERSEQKGKAKESMKQYTTALQVLGLCTAENNGQREREGGRWLNNSTELL